MTRHGGDRGYPGPRLATAFGSYPAPKHLRMMVPPSGRRSVDHDATWWRSRIPRAQTGYGVRVLSGPEAPPHDGAALRAALCLTYDGLVLEPILESTRARVSELRSRADEIEAAVGHAGAPRDFLGALTSPGLGVIAEIKRRSPSAGFIAPDLDPAELAAVYARGGATAISVLTEPDHFGGSMDDLAAVAAVTRLPVLCKDFILDPLQVDEARAGGADALLLIAAVLGDAVLFALLERSHRLGMTALVEAHGSEEVRRAVDSGSRVVGINNRDLATFEVDLGTAERLRHLIPQGVIAVAESGVDSPEDAERMRLAGFDAVLVGQAAVQAGDPAAFLSSLTESP